MTEYADWIGRTWTRTEQITENRLAEFRATLQGLLGPGIVPAGFHWCLSPDLANADDLGRDGHPKPGIFVPRLPLPRRMWAGGRLKHISALAPGDLVTRTITIDDLAFKTGSTGQLAFLTVHHLWTVGGETRIDEVQNIVYREDPEPGAPARAPKPAEPWPKARAWEATPDPVLLFRYSALMFNGHRIHYDLPYATGVEGYDGLVVHGPLQAVWMLNLAAGIFGRQPGSFTYRGVSPLVCGIPVRIEARETDSGLELRVRKEDGVVTMIAEATAA